MTNLMKSRILKVFGAKIWHDSVNIVANKRALIALRDAIDKAIEAKQSVEFFEEADGEGYKVTIQCENRTHEEWNELPTHYTDKITHPEEGQKNLRDLLSKLLL